VKNIAIRPFLFSPCHFIFGKYCIEVNVFREYMLCRIYWSSEQNLSVTYFYFLKDGVAYCEDGGAGTAVKCGKTANEKPPEVV